MSKISFRTAKELITETFNEWLDVNATRLGAALAYYSVFALGPLLIIIISIAGLVFGEEAASGQIFRQLDGIIGHNGAQAVQALVAGAAKPKAGTTAAILSTLTLLIGATGVVVQMKDALNTIWKVKPKPGHSFRIFFQKYLVSVAALLGLGFILMASLVMSTAIEAAGGYIGRLLPISEQVLTLINIVFSFTLISAIFALMFKMLPDVELRWRDVATGAIGTAIFFTIGKSLIALYLGRQSFDSSYGAASSIVAILAWVYYLAQVFFFGAEFTRIYTLKMGRKVTPSPDAEFEDSYVPPSLRRAPSPT